MKIKIKQDYWKVVQYSNREFDKIFGKGTAACAHYHFYRGKKKRADLAFRKGRVSLDIILHEVTHAYLANIDLYRRGIVEIEEIFCTLNQTYFLNIFLKATKIYQYLNS